MGVPCIAWMKAEMYNYGTSINLCEIWVKNMVDLLMIADDMTGALDSGIALVNKGISTEVLANPEHDLSRIRSDHRAIVINTASRHLDPQKAYDVVYRICRQATQLGIPLIYKKTDSVMRGNIGAELEAALLACGEETLYFAPAFPQMKRITRNGVQYVDDVPIHKSSFASDILNPITDAFIPNIIAQQSKLPVIDRENTTGRQAIRLFDGETEEDMRSAARVALARSRGVLAGCAGFAGAVAEVLQQGAAKTQKLFDPPLAVLCGSVHPASKAQLNYAARQGLRRFWVTSTELIQEDYLENGKGAQLVRELRDAAASGKTILVETAYEEEQRSGSVQHGEIAEKLPDAMGSLAVKLLEAGFSGTLMIFGGDSLGGFIKAMDVPGIEPVMEICPGVVLSKALWKGRELKFITKAGSFGNPELIAEIEALMCGGPNRYT